MPHTPDIYHRNIETNVYPLHFSDPPSVRSGEAVVRSEAGGERSAFISCSIDSNPPSKVSPGDM